MSVETSPRAKTGGRHLRPLRTAVIWPYYPPELGAGSNRGVALASYLASAGQDVILSTPRPSYLVSQDSDEQPPVPVSVRIPVRLRSTGRSRLVRILREVVGAAMVPLATWRAVRRADVVAVSTPPLLFGLAGVFTARMLGRPVLLDIRDMWPDVVIESGEVSGGAMTRIASRAALAGYRAATVISVVTRGSIDKLVALGVDPSKIVLAPNGVDEALIESDPASPSGNFADVHELGAATRSRDRAQFRIVYSGLLGPAQGVGLLLEALKLTGLPIRVDLVGEGSKADELKKAAEGANFEVRFHGLLPRHDALLIAARCDAAFVPLATSAMADTIPSKLFEAMAMSLPVLLVATGEAAEIARDSGGGLVSQPGDAAALAENIRRLARDRSLRLEMGEAATRYVAANFVRERIFATIRNELEQIAAPPAQTRG